MYRFLIAEDSKPIVRDLVNKIRSVCPQASETEIAYDGASALKLVQSFRPDVLLTDIKMPMMDGLTLIHRAKELRPGQKCIVISGYGDFEYTHRALKLQVDDYLLKPVVPEEFMRIVESLLRQIDRSRLSQQEEAVFPLLREGKQSEDLPAGSFRIAVVRSRLIPEETDLLDRAELHRVLSEFLSEGDALVSDTKYHAEKLILYREDRVPAQTALLVNRELFHILRERYPQLNMMYSLLPCSMQEMRKKYLDLSGTLSSLILLDAPQLYSDSVSYDRPGMAELNAEAAVLRKRVQSLMQSKTPGSIREEWRKDIEKWQGNCYPVLFLRRFLLVLAEELLALFNDDSQIRLEDSLTLVNRILDECRSYADLEDALVDLCETYMSAQADKPNSSMDLAKKIRNFLAENLYGSLTMQDIAEKFSFSPSYVSRLMKMYYHNSPMDYYNKLKMEEAQRLLSTHTELKVKDVSELLGYSDQYYFSKIFKAQYGISPAAYKKAE